MHENIFQYSVILPQAETYSNKIKALSVVILLNEIRLSEFAL